MHHAIRRAATAITAAAMLIGTAACGSQTSGSGDEPVTIEWWTRTAEQQKTEVEEFNKTHKNIQVKLTQISDDQYINKVGTALRGSNGPDVLEFDVANAPLFSAMGVLEDITDRAKELSFADDLNKGMAEMGKYNGKTYSLPVIASPSIMAYNKDLFRQAGLDPDQPPSNWDELKNAVAKISALGDDIYGTEIQGSCAGCLAFGFETLVFASGENMVTKAGPNQKTRYAESETMKDAMLMFREFWDKGYANPKGQTETGATSGQDFIAGKVGITFSGGYTVSQAQKEGHDVAAAPIPGKDGGYSAFAGGNNEGISAKSQKKEAAWTFIKWLLGKDAQTIIAESGETPVRGDMFTDEFIEKYPLLATAAKVNDSGMAPNSIATNALQTSATSPFLSLFQKVVFQNEDYEKTAKQADADSAEIIKQAYEQLGS